MRKFIFSRMRIVLPKEVFKTCHGQKKRFKYYALRFMKIAFKMASEDPKKKMLKSTKKSNCPASLAITEALTIHPTN